MIERFKEQAGYYQEPLLENQIFRTRESRNLYKMHGIRLFGPKFEDRVL